MLAVSTTNSYLTCSDPVTVHIPRALVSALTTKPTEKLAVMQNGEILSCVTPGTCLHSGVALMFFGAELIACNLEKVN
jgi:hypothetical protein